MGHNGTAPVDPMFGVDEICDSLAACYRSWLAREWDDRLEDRRYETEDGGMVAFESDRVPFSDRIMSRRSVSVSNIRLPLSQRGRGLCRGFVQIMQGDDPELGVDEIAARWVMSPSLERTLVVLGFERPGADSEDWLWRRRRGDGIAVIEAARLPSHPPM
jgi:hypothetical protein